MKWTKRELQEIFHVLFYAETTAHGTIAIVKSDRDYLDWPDEIEL